MSTARAQTLTSVPDELEALLKAHIPTSLPVLRRVQSAKYEKRMSSGARIVLVSEDAATDSQPEKFTVAFVDYAGGPDTQMWLYSTLEDDDDGDGDKASDKVYREQLEVLVRELVRLNLEYGKETAYPGTMLLGTLNTRVRRILEGMNRIQPRPTDYYNKWLFRAEALPQRDGELPEGMTWDTATLADCEVVAARTDIPRTPYVDETLSHGDLMCAYILARTLLLTLPNQIIRHEDGTPISWAFLGPDGALISLHCEVGMGKYQEN
ncbi:hypothetical protein ACO1O0_005916 [Amphichorda felina]